MHARPVTTIDDVSRWLPSFNTLITKASGDLLNRVELADIDFAPGTVGVPEGVDAMEYRKQNRETEVCPHEPPEPHILGLIYDILLSLHENGESLFDICEYPQLKLLEMTPQEVIAESELRKAELEKNHKCKYCAEYIFNDDEDCRFCGGNVDKRPKTRLKYVNKDVDKQYLKDIIQYEAAERTINGTTPIPQEILDANGISKEALDQEILRQRGKPSALPMPRFYKRMHELELSSYWSPEALSVSRLVDLGSALDTKKDGRPDEAMIVYEHGLKRTEGNEDLMQERSRVLDYMGFLYQRKDDFVSYKKCHDMAQECKTFGMTDEMKEMILQSDLINMQMIAEPILDEDPEKRLEQLNKMFGGKADLLDQMVTQMDSTVPGLGEVMAAIGDTLDGQMQSSRLALEAAVAQKKGDLETAESKYRSALQLSGDDWIGAGVRINLTLSLAEIKHLQGDDPDAEVLLKEALKCATDYCEAMPEFGDTYLWQVYNATACYKRDTGKAEESEENFIRTLELHEASSLDMLQRYGGEKADYSGQTAQIKRDYAKLLRNLKRNEEAEKHETEAAELQKEADEQAAKSKAHREKYSQHMRDIMPDQNA